MDKISFASGILLALSSTTSLSADFTSADNGIGADACTSGHPVEIIRNESDSPERGEITIKFCNLSKEVPMTCEVLGEVVAQSSPYDSNEIIIESNDGDFETGATKNDLREASIRALKFCPPV